MIGVRRPISSVLALSFVAGGLLAQDLGQAAARERARREKKAREGKPAPARVYTNEELGRGKAGSAESGGSGSEGQAYTPEQSSYRGERNTEENDSEEASWRQRAASARGPLTQAEGQLAQIDARIASIREQLSPLRMGGPEPDTNKMLALQQELTEAETERVSAKSAVDEARKEWQGFLEEARRSGVPAGWLGEAPR